MNPSSPAARPWALAPNPLRLTELDIASGIVLGTNKPPQWPEVERDPLDVLFDEARELLQRGRCVVAFSGGRDSSAVLAALLHVARRDGFDEPVAVTARWPGDAAADESAWQEHVARELRVKHWEVISPGTDFDLLGPLATRLLRNHGLFWPAPTAALMPMIEAAGDGVLVTGQGGDEVFGTWSTAGAWAVPVTWATCAGYATRAAWLCRSARCSPRPCPGPSASGAPSPAPGLIRAG